MFIHMGADALVYLGSPLLAPVFTSPKDAHLGTTSRTRHVYLYLSHQHLQGVGYAPVLAYVMGNKKAAYYCPWWKP